MGFEPMCGIPSEPRDRKKEWEREHIENADKMIFTYGVIKLSIINKMKII